MQYPFLDILRCPLTKTPLRFELLSEFEKNYGGLVIREIKEGLLYSEAGFIFPVIDGIPRLLIESMYDYAAFLKLHLPGYASVIVSIEKAHGELLRHCTRKNKKTKQSFELEWSFIAPAEKEKIWRDENKNMAEILLHETGEQPSFFHGKKVVDVGSGHGIMTSKIASMSALAVGVELSKAVDDAYKKNQAANAWYIQADLQYLPFEEASFDLLYSSGVIHHTNNTELSLSLIEPVVKPGGKLCLWLYHPREKTGHKMILLLRNFTKRLPVKAAFVFLMIFVFPFTYLLKKIKNRKKLTYREEIIDLLDQFTPEFRDEIEHEEAIAWLEKRYYSNIEISTRNQFGFSITGIKKPLHRI